MLYLIVPGVAVVITAVAIVAIVIAIGFMLYPSTAPAMAVDLIVSYFGITRLS